MALPSSVSKPAIKSCRLYTVGDITSKSGVCYALSLPQIQRAVSSNRLLSILLQRFLFSHLSITYLTILLAFSLTVHYSRITPFAAKSGLTTPPAQRCRYFAILSYSTVASSSLQHVQLSRTELHGTSKESHAIFGYKKHTYL